MFLAAVIILRMASWREGASGWAARHASRAATALAFAQAMGYPIPEWVYAVLGALGLGTLRAGVANEVRGR